MTLGIGASKTGRSQITGGMVSDIGSALMEETVLDLAEYLVAVNAGVPDLDVIFLEGRDDKANLLGAKGIGELGVCGVGAAIVNAIYNATGTRVRSFPITLDKLLPSLPVTAL